MKKILSLALAGVMMFAALPVAYATTDHSNGTQVSYDADDRDGDGQLDNLEYTITVPASLEPGTDGTVTLKGMWPSNATVKVTADAEVVLTNSINAADTKTLAITFGGIEKAGDNVEEKTYTEGVSVAAMPADALFGTWSGKFNYNVEYVEPVRVIAATFGRRVASPGCHPQGEHSWSECFITEENTLTWEELQLEENGAKYNYNASKISDTEIGDGAFHCCGSLRSLIIPDSVTTIGSAFDSSGLYNLTIGSGVTSIAGGAFRYNSLDNVEFKGTMEQWNALSIDYSDVFFDNKPNSIICSDGTITRSDYE